MNPSRRRFLQLSALASGSLFLSPQLVAQALRPTSGDRRLVLLFLEGGNDGLNTVIPFADDLYHRARPKLALRPNADLHLNDSLALHPELAPWRSLFEDGKLSVMQGVGYDRPNLSHFVSRDIWHSGQRDIWKDESTASRVVATGWVGRATASMDHALPPVALGASEAPLLLKGPERDGLTVRNLGSMTMGENPLRPQVAPPTVQDDMPAEDMPQAIGPLARLAATAEDAMATAQRLREAAAQIPAGKNYPNTGLSARLREMARLVRIEQGPPVLWTRLGGFDTHALQTGTHSALLRELSRSTAAFVEDLASDGSLDRTLVLVYSEFGRRVAENGSLGTDHGTAGPVFALGGGLKGGVLGGAPDLRALQQGNLVVERDFRALFSEVLADWLGWPSAGLFDGAYADGKSRLGLLA